MRYQSFRVGTRVDFSRLRGEHAVRSRGATQAVLCGNSAKAGLSGQLMRTIAVNARNKVILAVLLAAASIAMYVSIFIKVSHG